jgi:hypothetical protein
VYVYPKKREERSSVINLFSPLVPPPWGRAFRGARNGKKAMSPQERVSDGVLVSGLFGRATRRGERWVSAAARRDIPFSPPDGEEGADGTSPPVDEEPLNSLIYREVRRTGQV